MSGRPVIARVEGAPSAEAIALRRLIRVWAWWSLAGAAGLAVASLLLWPTLGPGLIRWLVPNLITLGAVQVFVRLRLPANRKVEGGPLLGDLGAGNHVTVLRGVLISQLPGYLFFPWPAGLQGWMPTLTFTSSLIADYVDGYLARRARAVTGLGEALDIEFDGLGLFLATGLAVHYGQVPLVYLLTVGSARYFYLLAGWTARRLGRTVYPLPPSTTRRGLAGVTMELASGALWPVVPPELITLGGTIIGLPFLAGFARDGLIHLGWLDPASPGYLVTRRRLVHAFTFVLPPALRLLLFFLLWPSLLAATTSFRETVEAARPGGLTLAVAVAAAALALTAVSLGMVVLGIAGRAGAVGLIVVYGLRLAAIGLPARGVAAWGCAMAIYLLGTGAGSIWQPERSLYLRRAGEHGES